MIYEIKVTADSVAWYGAIVATISVLFSGLKLWADRSRVRISYQRNTWVVGEQNYYDKSKTYLNITVINGGRRTVAIGNVAIKLITKGSWLLGDSFAVHKNKILNEQNPRVDFLVSEKDIDFSKAYYIQVYDQTGKEYRKYLHNLPTFKKWQYLLKNFLFK